MLCAKIKDLKIILPLSVFQITFKKGHRSKTNIAQGFRTEPHPNAPPIRMSLSLLSVYHISIILSSFLGYFLIFLKNVVYSVTTDAISKETVDSKLQQKTYSGIVPTEIEPFIYMPEQHALLGIADVPKHPGASVLNGFSAFRDKGTHTARVFSPKDPKDLFTQNRTVPKKFL